MENIQEFDPYSSNSYDSQKDSNGVYMRDRLRGIKEKVHYYLIKILPTIGNFISFVFFYIKKIIVSGIKIAMEQMKF